MISHGNEPVEKEISTIVAELLDTVFKRANPNPADMWNEHKFIRERIDRISVLQASLSDTDIGLSAKRGPGALEEFLSWCDRKGIFRNVDVAEDPKLGYQLIAVEDQNAGDIVITVPRNAIFCLDQVKKLAGLRKLFLHDPMLAKMDNVGLALGVCALQLKEDSSWAPYINILPSSFDTPLFFSLQQFEDLRPSPLFDDALNHYRSIARQFTYYLSIIDDSVNFDKRKKEDKQGKQPPLLYDGPFNIGNFTFGLYRWAVSVVCTRINQLPSEYEKMDEKAKVPKQIPCLMPLLDMANHSFVEESSFHPGYSDMKDLAVLPVNTPVKKGEPITIVYGRRTTAEFLLMNAFSPAVNPYNKYKLRIGLTKTDRFIKERLSQMSKLGYNNLNTVYSFNLFVSKEGEMPFEESLVRFARVFMSNPPIDEVVESDDSLKKGLQFVETRLSLLLRGYTKSKLEGESNTNILLRQEKAILEHVVTFLQEWRGRL
ncbi:hypothetical protein PENTCL1PPCAC_11258 [Pristionchus entomophagus]|uniref:protein-histidine N-methyltransferase n=1 Tax=Pristionchus entomophagus TaxID=358040 RepID=A0AAV5T8D4_9BILA|nr:hypothetical protein PENTCL1PPCAC_11258 [Pristionchus entomophagus]